MIEDDKKRMKELYSLIKKYNKYYYEYDNPLITDSEYDNLIDELKKLENKYPDFKESDSPTEKISVGANLSSKFEKIRHKNLMLSLEDVFNEQEIFDFDKRVKKNLNIQNIEYIVELKIDGLAMSLMYENGNLLYAATRGDGLVGENVTKNVISIEGIPQHIKEKKTLEIRGEIFMSKKNLEKINEERKREEKPLFANARNASAGSVRQIHSSTTNSRNLEAFWYHLPNAADFNIQKQSDALEYMKNLGFKINENYRVCSNIEEVLSYIEEYKKKRDSLLYDIDGIVIKINDFKFHKFLGNTSKNPRWAVAFKFPAPEAITLLYDIVYNVGRTGRITPNALLRPTRIEGSLVSRATLHNEDYINEKNIFPGSKVVIRKAGDIIPEVVGLAEKNDNVNKKFKMIEECPICKSKLVKKNTIHYCLNENCEARKIRGIIYFASKDAMDISGLGESIIEEFFNLGFLKKITDIYKLEKFRDKILQINGWSNKSFDNLMSSIEESKKNSLEKVLIGLGIERINKKIVRILLKKKYKTIDDFIAIKKEEIINIRDIGPKAAESICNFFKKKENLEIIDELKKIGFNLSYNDDQKINKENFFYDKNIVLTGTLKHYGRSEAIKILEDLGANTSSSLTKKTDLVICGENPGSKLTKAEKEGIKILKEDEFIIKLKEYGK